MGCLALLVGLFLCIGGSMFVLDRVCYSTLSQQLPIYPGGEVRVERHNAFSSRGMGETYIELWSADPRDVVEDWYVDTAGEYTYRASRNRDPAYQLGKGQRAINRSPDGEGTQIELYGTCMQ